MNIPNKIKIQSHTYKVIIGDTEGADGYLKRDTGEIHINKHLAPTEQYCTFIHEALHAMNNEMPEEKVEFLAQALTQFLLDNKLVK